MKWLAKAEGKKTNLSTLAHHQTMELLRLGDKSKNPAIAQAAIDIAREREKNFHDSAKKAPTRTTAILVTVVTVVSIVLCWYVLTNDQSPLAGHLVELIIGGGFLTIALYLLIYGHLTQANFMTIMSWFKEHIQRSKPSISPPLNGEVPLGHEISASADPEVRKAKD